MMPMAKRRCGWRRARACCVSAANASTCSTVATDCPPKPYVASNSSTTATASIRCGWPPKAALPAPRWRPAPGTPCPCLAPPTTAASACWSSPTVAAANACGWARRATGWRCLNRATGAISGKVPADCRPGRCAACGAFPATTAGSTWCCPNPARPCSKSTAISRSGPSTCPGRHNRRQVPTMSSREASTARWNGGPPPTMPACTGCAAASGPAFAIWATKGMARCTGCWRRPTRRVASGCGPRTRAASPASTASAGSA